MNDSTEVIVCPFHQEETPSLVIDHITCRAYCFGCRKEYTLDEVREGLRNADEKTKVSDD